MKKHYQIDRERAVQKFRLAASRSDDAIQLALPMKKAAALVQQGLMQLALATFTQVAEQMMRWEVDQIGGPRQKMNALREAVRWGSQRCYCVVAGQKVPLQRPRVRDVRQGEVPLGSYESLQRASLMEKAVWNKVMHGLTTRGYSAIVRELKESYGIEKSTVSEHFVEASPWTAAELETRPLDHYQFCALLWDGICFDKQVIVALGLTLQRKKMILGLRQGATENSTVVKHLLEDLQQRGIDFEVPRIYVLDGSKALHAAVRKIAGPCAVFQRCQVHIAGRDPRLPEGWKVPSRASPCEPGSLGSGMAG